MNSILFFNDSKVFELSLPFMRNSFNSCSYFEESLKNYENTMNNLIGGKYNNVSKYPGGETLLIEENKKNKIIPVSTNYERLINKDRTSYLDEKENTPNINNSSKPNNMIAIKEDFNYEKNLQNFTSMKNFNQELKSPEDTKLGGMIKDKDRDKDDFRTLNSTGTPSDITGKYNYSERFKEDMNKQRFASEKRNYRPSYGNI